MELQNSMYFIAVVLPEEINRKILPLKQWMFEKYTCKVGLKSPAHITLIPPYWMSEDLETQLMNDLNEVAGSIESFKAGTANFSGFKPSTLFIAVEENLALKNTRDATNAFFKERPLYKMKFDTRPFHPHITIATRDLYKKSYYEAREHFKTMEFTETWVVDGISLLKHNKKNWDVIHTSRLKNIV